MITTLALIESSLLFVLAIIHFYWAFGGKWGFDKALPTNEEGKRVLNPKWFDSLLVGLGLFVFALFFLVKGNMITINLPKWLTNYAGWIIAAIFLVRAIGDFKYIGFFKKVKNTTFAKYDMRYYSPLCLILTIIIILIQIL